jgi:hypothetical protein
VSGHPAADTPAETSDNGDKPAAEGEGANRKRRRRRPRKAAAATAN